MVCFYACWLRDGSGNPFASVSEQKIGAYSPVRLSGTAPNENADDAMQSVSL